MKHQGLRGWRSSLEQYRRMLAYVRPYRLHPVLAAICLVSMSLLSLAMSWAVKDQVDQQVIVAIMNWRLMLLMAVAIPGMMLLARLLGRRIRKITQAAMHRTRYYALQFQWGDDEFQTDEDGPARPKTANDTWQSGALQLYLPSEPTPPPVYKPGHQGED
jgi:hypothetical protein